MFNIKGVSFLSSFYFASIPLSGEPLKYLLAAAYALIGHLIVSMGKKAIDKMIEKKEKTKP